MYNSTYSFVITPVIHVFSAIYEGLPIGPVFCVIANIRSAIQRWHEGHTLHQGILESAQGIYREIMDHVRGSPCCSNTGHVVDEMVEGDW